MKHLLLALLFCFLYMLGSGQNALKNQLDTVLHALYPDADAPGISVYISKSGQPIYTFQQGLAHRQGHTEINVSSRFRMASVSKQVTAKAIYWLATHNKIDLYAPLSTWFSKVPDSWQQITPFHLLTHSSGIWDYEELIPSDQAEQLSDQDVLRLSKQQDNVYFPAGTQFRYSNTGYCLLALLVEQVAHESFADFVQTHLFTPIGIQNGMVYYPDSKIKDRAYGYHPKGDDFIFADQSLTSATQGDGGVYFSATDYHRWAIQELFPDFKRVDFSRSFWESGVNVQEHIKYNLGLFAFRDTNDRLHLFHSGESTGFNNIVYSIPEDELVVSIFTNRDDLGIAKAFEEIANSLEMSIPVPENLFIWLSKVYSINL